MPCECHRDPGIDGSATRRRVQAPSSARSPQGGRTSDSRPGFHRKHTHVGGPGVGFVGQKTLKPQPLGAQLHGQALAG